MQVVVDALLTSYHVSGEGKTLVLLHGWGDSSSTFKSIGSKLAGRYRVVTLDLPGFGDTESPKEVWNLDNYASFVREFLRKVNINKVYGFVGHSNGGALAVRGLATGTLTADKLVLLAASGIRPARSARRTAFKVAAKTGKAATFWLPLRHKQLLRKRLYGVAGSDMLVAPHLQETFKQTVRQDIREDARQIKLPTLLIYGTGDRATPLKDGQLLTGCIKDSKLEAITGAGHFIHHDREGDVLRLVGDFLK